MAKLLVSLPAFAADYTVAMSVMRHSGAMVAMHGPAGCLGNYTGFVEPDYFADPGMILCSMIGENEAIMGLDGIFIDKIVGAAEDLRPPFIAVIGTPVPAVIGTDYASICTEVEDRTGIPCVYVDATGFNDYAWGVEKAYNALLRFVEDDGVRDPDAVNIIGYNVVDYCDTEDLEVLEARLAAQGKRINCVVGDCGIDDVKKLARAGENLVVSSSGLRFANTLRRRYGTPYRIGIELGDGRGPAPATDVKRVMVIGDQVMANAMREYIEQRFGCTCDVVTFFTFSKKIAREDDAKVVDEFDFAPLTERGYDMYIGDPIFRRIVPEGSRYVSVPHPAVSSRLHWDDHVPLLGKGMLDLLDASFAGRS